MSALKIYPLGLSIIALTQLTGFFYPDVNAEVTRFMHQVQAQTKASDDIKLPPLVHVQEVKETSYTAGDKDPFALQDFVTDARMATVSGGSGGDNREQLASAPIPHQAFFLEQYDLAQLQMVGTLRGMNGNDVALIQTPDAGVMQAKVGQYMGKNNGLILSISESQIQVQEKIKVANGWRNREQTLELIQ